VCDHQEREAVDQALVQGEALRIVAQRFAISPWAAFRHKREHLPGALANAHQAEEAAHGDDLLARLEALSSDVSRIKATAEAAQDLRTALMAVRELTRIVELLAEMRQELDRRPVVNLHLSGEWAAVRAVVVGALGQFPEARLAVVEALGRLPDGGAGV
jgi:hypothetical protein